MAVYQYKCPACKNQQDLTHGIHEKPEVACSNCQTPMQKSLTGGSGSFIKGITASKYYKEDRLRKKTNAQLEVKQLERYGGFNKLVPNIGGEEVGSWKEAAQLAKEKGAQDTSRFGRYIREEDNSKNSAGVNESRLKALKEKARNIR